MKTVSMWKSWRLWRRQLAPVALTALVGLLPAPAAATCGAIAVCGDVGTSLVGRIGVGIITLTWSTTNESSQVGYYKIWRYNCSDPAICSTFVATVSLAGTCGSNHDYTYVDQPATPLAQWSYSVEVWKSDGTRQCLIDVVPW